MTEIPQETAQRLTQKARRYSASGDYPAAIEEQRQAIRILQNELNRMERQTPELADEREKYAHRLSDCLGRLGGIYRRAGLIPEGIEAYRQGKEIERQYRLDDSYNLTNWIVLRLLEDPARLAELAGDINQAIDLIRGQVEGPRRDQWWAWADLGLVCHLGGRPREAREAYERFKQTGARRADYQSVLAVLNPLKQQFEPSAPELAAQLGDTIRDLQASSGKP